jgi:hypothetical protein
MVKATLNPSATPLNRSRVGKRSVSTTANVPLTNAATTPAITISRVGSRRLAASEL